jgi:hypothetical protein
MTAGFLFFAVGLGLVIGALKDKSLAEVFSGVLSGDVPLGTGKTYDSTSTETGQPLSQTKETGPGLLQFLQTAARDQFGLTITEPIGQDSGGHVTNSLHKQGRAFDAHGTNAQMKAYTDWVSKNFGKSLTELIHNPGGSIKNGKPVAPSFWAELWAKHRNHVHVGI